MQQKLGLRLKFTSAQYGKYSKCVAIIVDFQRFQRGFKKAQYVSNNLKRFQNDFQGFQKVPKGS